MLPKPILNKLNLITMRKLSALLILVVMTIYSCSETESEKVTPQLVTPEQAIIPKADIDAFVVNEVEQNGEFNWNLTSDDMLWSALVHTEQVVTVGYEPTTETGRALHTVNVEDEPWVLTRTQIIDDLLESAAITSQTPMKAEDLMLASHEVLPYMEVKVTGIAMIKALRDRPDVRYVEPADYAFSEVNYAEGKVASNSGCSNDPNNGLGSSDYTVISPNAKQSWNYSYANIPQAWSYSTGDNISVGLIDTGISPNQNKLNGSFSSGNSTGRFVNKYGTYVSSWWWWASPDGPNDQCGHGTAMAGVIAAPRTSSGSSVGVAYKANLVAVRGTGDVLVNGGKEITGVSDALVLLGNRSDVKIISMSIGDLFSHSKIKDGIRYAYGKGKLVFAAAGTSTSFTNWAGVIFPANMSETVAVTGVKTSGYQRCDVCHSGSKVDFTAVMERASDDRHPLSLSMSGDQPSTVGGSSVATATTAGIAALVWATNPNMSRAQVLNRLKNAADIYPSRNSQYGWGNIDALVAVRGY